MDSFSPANRRWCRNGHSAVGPDDDPANAGGRPGVFEATQWSVVLAAGQTDSAQASAALEKLCRAYWSPLYAYARRRGHSAEDAEDLTQGFFAKLLEKQVLSNLTREGGKFRSFLLTTFQRFVANEWHHQHAQKRGGGTAAISIDTTTEASYQSEPVEHTTPEALYIRDWALKVLDRVLDRLREEYRMAGKLELFECLKGWLTGGDDQLGYVEAAAALHMNGPAVRMSVHRLRRRYQELLRAEIADTVARPEEIDDELRALIGAFST